MDTSHVFESHHGPDETAGTIMPEATPYRGLCATCKNASTCTYPRDPQRPVLDCCEHEGHEECEGSVSLALLGTGQIFSRGTDSRVRDTDSAEFKGLCRNCENRDTCTFPKPEGGVWRCEEYR